MSWSKLHGGAHRHRKIQRLEVALGVSELEARGLALSLWSWTIETEPDGDLSDYQPVELARALGWRGDAGALVDALVSCGLLDRDPEQGSMHVHDWMEHAEGWKDAQRKRAARNKNQPRPENVQDSPRTVPDIPRTVRKTARERRGEEKRSLSPTPLAADRPVQDTHTHGAGSPTQPPPAPVWTWPADVCHPERWVELWNAVVARVPTLRAVLVLSGAQITGLRNMARDEAWWRATLDEIPRSAWLRGERKNWTPDPRWLLERGAENAERVHRGAYSDETDAAARSAMTPSTGRDPRTRERRDLTVPPKVQRTPPPPEVLALFRGDHPPRAPPPNEPSGNGTGT